MISSFRYNKHDHSLNKCMNTAKRNTKYERKVGQSCTSFWRLISKYRHHMHTCMGKSILQNVSTPRNLTYVTRYDMKLNLFSLSTNRLVSKQAHSNYPAFILIEEIPVFQHQPLRDGLERLLEGHVFVFTL